MEVEQQAGFTGSSARVRVLLGTEGASSLSSVFTLCNSAIGAGVLSLPYAFQCAGEAAQQLPAGRYISVTATQLACMNTLCADMPFFTLSVVKSMHGLEAAGAPACKAPQKQPAAPQKVP